MHVIFCNVYCLVKKILTHVSIIYCWLFSHNRFTSESYMMNANSRVFSDYSEKTCKVHTVTEFMSDNVGGSPEDWV